AQTGAPFAFAPQPLLAADRVRFVGEPVALVVADSRDQALDAAEAIAVTYEALPAVTTAAAATAPGAPPLSDQAPGHGCLAWRTGDWPAVDAAFAAAKHVVTLALDNHRIVTNPMEPRGVVGVFDTGSGRFTLHVSTQNVHMIRDHVARALGVPATAVRL